ncbi:hypothetical protein [Aureimonas altamirensis]|uniref:hypothetical protein n=1 Tax=Aureimonas altamirensis TaxID=370622 RepID=UPI002556CC7D|nr:hypothetical protein [Aureimonas altamirensis]
MSWGKEFGKQIVEQVKAHVASRVGPLDARIKKLEATVRSLQAVVDAGKRLEGRATAYDAGHEMGVTREGKPRIRVPAGRGNEGS